MAYREIIQKDTNDVLYKIAAKVTQDEFGSKELESILRNMRDTLDAEKSGVALAAPQIAISKRIFVVSHKVTELTGKELKNFVFINPEIIKTSTKKVILDEGCLSVTGCFGDIKRHDKVTVKATDASGKKFTRGASGLLSEIFQHEIDHLDGILFTESAKNLRFITDDKDKS